MKCSPLIFETPISQSKHFLLLSVFMSSLISLFGSPPPQEKKNRWWLVLVCFAAAESISSHLIKCCCSASGYAQGVL